MDSEPSCEPTSFITCCSWRSNCSWRGPFFHELRVQSRLDVPEPPVPVPGLEDLDSEGGDLRDAVTAVRLLFSKLHLMDCLGFKVVSQLGVVSTLLEVCEEWELGPAARLAADTGLALSARIHGREGGQYAEWARRAGRA